MLAATALVSAGLLLTGCVPAEPVVTPVETGAIQPIFASDDEALAAAVEAYTQYQRVSYEIGASGGADYEQLRPLVTNEWYEVEVEGFERFASDGYRVAGTASVSNFSLQQWWEEPRGIANVIVYFCDDLTNARIVDLHGVDVTPIDRNDTVPIEVAFVSSATAVNELLVSEVIPWDGIGLCS